MTSARVVAKILIEGDLLGKTTHGLNLLPLYLRSLEAGKMTTTGQTKVMKKSATTLLLDARYLPGPVVLKQAIVWAQTQARKNGSAMVAIRRSHHLAALAAYLAPVAERGQVILLMCSDPINATIAPPGGIEGVCSPNPIAMGIPTKEGPILIDTTASSASNGQVARYHAEKRKFSSAFLQTAQGRLTHDPSVLYAQPPGTILPLGGLELGYKGFAFSIMVEALTSALAGHGRADKGKQWGASVFLQIIDPKFFGGTAKFCRETDFFATTCRKSRRRIPGKAIRLPGEKSLALRRQQLSQGVLLYPSIQPALLPWAEKFGVKFPHPVG
jgi:L-lactate dehydrogenase